MKKQFTKHELERGYSDRDLFSAGVLIGCVIMSALLLLGALIAS